jgi:hypothetical protein
MDFAFKTIVFGLSFGFTLTLLSFTTWKVITNDFITKIIVKKIFVIFFIVGCGLYPIHFQKNKMMINSIEKTNSLKFK